MLWKAKKKLISNKFSVVFYMHWIETDWSASRLHINWSYSFQTSGGDTTMSTEAWNHKNSSGICTLLLKMFHSYSSTKYEMWSTNFRTELLFIAFSSYLVLSPNVLDLWLNAVNSLILPLLETSVEILFWTYM